MLVQMLAGTLPAKIRRHDAPTPTGPTVWKHPQTNADADGRRLR
jgi:hypothetical protein